MAGPSAHDRQGQNQAVRPAWCSREGHTAPTRFAGLQWIWQCQLPHSSLVLVAATGSRPRAQPAQLRRTQGATAGALPARVAPIARADLLLDELHPLLRGRRDALRVGPQRLNGTALRFRVPEGSIGRRSHRTYRAIWHARGAEGSRRRV